MPVAATKIVQIEPGSTVLDAPAPDLFVRCADEATCPSAVGMLIVDAGDAREPERCTATLIASDRILTASHCLAASTRHIGAACPRTWIAFPGTASVAAEQVACQRVEYAAPVLSEDALHQEHAVLRLARSVARAPLAIDATRPAPGSIVTVASVTPHPIYGSTHLLTTRLCRAVDSSLATAALGELAANVGWLSQCPIARGNSGSPVLDYDQRIRAIVHGGTNLTSAFGATSGLSGSGPSHPPAPGR
jgi:secreted trypsin-like serine protease